MPTTENPREAATPEERRAMGIADAHWFRHMATQALRDGKPRGEKRATSARTAARIILSQAKMQKSIVDMISDGVASGGCDR